MGHSVQLRGNESEWFNYDEVERAVFGRVEQSGEDSRRETLDAVRLILEYVLGPANNDNTPFRKRDVGSRALMVARIMYPTHPMVRGSFGQVAERIGCSKQAVHQLEAKARRHFNAEW